MSRRGFLVCVGSISVLMLLLSAGNAAAYTYSVPAHTAHQTAHGNWVITGDNPVEVTEGTYGDGFEGDGASIILTGDSSNEVYGDGNTMHMHDNSDVEVHGDENHVSHENEEAGTQTDADSYGSGNTTSGGYESSDGGSPVEHIYSYRAN